MLWTLAFWQGAAERAIKTFAQSTSALIAAQAVGVIGITELDWRTIVSIAGLAAVASVFTSIGNAESVAATYASAAPRRALPEEGATTSEPIGFRAP